MKRGLVFSLCALAALATSVQAQTVNISLNLRYTNPAQPALGGKWFLAVKTTEVGGVAGLSAYISGIDGPAGANPPVFGAAAIGTGLAAYESITQGNLGANVDTVGGTPYAQTIGGAVNVVFGQNNAIGGTITPGVGTSTFNFRQNDDPLRKIAGGIAPQPANWNDSTILMSGGFGATRPQFVSAGANSTDANVYDSTPALGEDAVDAAVTLTVRGDSRAALGLEGGGEGLAFGDANRDFAINGVDLGIVLNNISTSGGWDAGDSNNDGSVNGVDLGVVLNNISTSQIPPAAAPVPEPSALALVALCGSIAGVYRLRRRSA